MAEIVASINSRLKTCLIPLAMLTSPPFVVTINEGIKGRIKFLGGIIKLFPPSSSNSRRERNNLPPGKGIWRESSVRSIHAAMFVVATAYRSNEIRICNDSSCRRKIVSTKTARGYKFPRTNSDVCQTARWEISTRGN